MPFAFPSRVAKGARSVVYGDGGSRRNRLQQLIRRKLKEERLSSDKALPAGFSPFVGNGLSRQPPAENVGPQEGPLERTKTVDAATAKASGFAHCIEARNPILRAMRTAGPEPLSRSNVNYEIAKRTLADSRDPSGPGPGRMRPGGLLPGLSSCPRFQKGAPHRIPADGGTNPPRRAADQAENSMVWLLWKRFSGSHVSFTWANRL